MVTNLARNWWVLILRGLASIVFGVLAYLWPGLTVAVLVLFFGAYALWDGVFALIGAFRGETTRRWALILEGLAGIAAGLVAFLWTGAAMVALLFVIAIWAVVTGVMEIAAAIRLREEIHGEWFLMLMGLLSVVFGVAVVLYPAAGLLAITWMIAAYAVIFGILQIVLGIRVRTHNEDQYIPV